MSAKFPLSNRDLVYWPNYGLGVVPGWRIFACDEAGQLPMFLTSIPKGLARAQLPAARWLALLLVCICTQSFAAGASQEGQTLVHILDYVSVDYPTFVHGGQVLNSAEYDEQREFAAQAVELLEQSAPAANKDSLLEKARSLRGEIDNKAEGATVAKLAADLRGEVIRSYGVIVVPSGTVDLGSGAKLFETHCSSCHGNEGRGDGVAAQSMDPKPADFHNAARMDALNLYGLYNTITLGVNGTPMRAFGELSESDRWALAFFVGSMRSDREDIARGESLWKRGEGREQLGNLHALVTTSIAETRGAGGAPLTAVQAYLSAHPEALRTAGVAPLELTRQKLDETLAAYRAGDRERARQVAIAGYLEGFELIEASLDNVDAPLRGEVERQMMALRSMIGSGQPVERVAEQTRHIKSLLAQAEERLSVGGLTPTTAFVSSLLILLREGLEALLVLAAIIAFVLKTERRDALPYIHLGWIVALALGGLTWVVARYMLAVSGANRELTEGITALIAAAMLLYVGYWLHSKSYAHAWQAFIHDQVATALGKQTLWAMAGISFLAVYRELFEIILFYEALWAQAGPQGHHAVILGMLAAILLLAAIGGLILKYSLRLPIGPFFAATSGLLALLAVVFAGNGIAALQEAGAVNSTAIHFISVPLLGIYPTLQGLLAQGIGLVLVLVGMAFARRGAANHSAA